MLMFQNPSQFEEGDEGEAEGEVEIAPSESEEEEEEYDEEVEMEEIRPKSPPKEKTVSKHKLGTVEESDDSALWPSESESESSDEDLGPLEKLHHTMFLK